MTTTAARLAARRAPGAAVWKSSPPDLSRTSASIARVAIEALDTLSASAEQDRVLYGLRIKSADMVIAALDWVGFADSMTRVTKYLTQAMKSFARGEIPPSITKAEDLEFDFAPRLVFDLIDERAIAYAEQQAGILVRQINEDVLRNTRALVVESLNGNLTVDQLARTLRQYIPLSERDAAFVQRYQERQFERLLTEGRTPAQSAATASRLAESMSRRKLRERAELIARTELSKAANQGRYAGWEAGIEAGRFDTASVKEWIAAPGACPECVALDGMLAPWDQPFENGMDMPPDHPACRCSAVLLPPDADILQQMADQAPLAT